jgi:hypothetical protein
MTVTGGFPAPGPQDREPPRDGSYAGPPAPGPAAPPQTPMLAAYKPGIVPLRPLQFGDILDGAVKAVRFNPKSMVGLSALVLGAFLVPSAALAIVVTNLVQGRLNTSGTDANVAFADLLPNLLHDLLLVSLPALVQFLFTVLATGLLSGLLIHVVGQAVLGRKPDIGQTWQSTRGRLPALLVLTFLTLLFLLLLVAVLMGPGVLLLVNDHVGAGLILLLGFLAIFVPLLAISTKISMAAPAIVLEGHGVFAGLRRSFALTKGVAFWRVLGITLVAGILAGIAGWLLGLPFSIIGTVIAFLAGQDSESGQMAVTFVSHLSALLTGAITTPFVAAVTGLIYIDRRMRLEALDVVLVREAQSNPAPRT